MLTWIFGKAKLNTVHAHQPDKASGYLELEKARVRWFLSTDFETLPESIRLSNIRTYRSLTLEGEEIEFSDGFTDLHTQTYQQILQGNGFGLKEAYPSIEIVHHIRTAPLASLNGDYHPFIKQNPKNPKPQNPKTP